MASCADSGQPRVESDAESGGLRGEVQSVVTSTTRTVYNEQGYITHQYVNDRDGVEKLIIEYIYDKDGYVTRRSFYTTHDDSWHHYYKGRAQFVSEYKYNDAHQVVELRSTKYGPKIER